MDSVKNFFKTFWHSVKAEIRSLWQPFFLKNADEHQSLDNETSSDDEAKQISSAANNELNFKTELPLESAPTATIKAEEKTGPSPSEIRTEITGNLDKSFADFFRKSSGENWKNLIQNAKDGGSNSVIAAKILSSTNSQLDTANSSINEMVLSINEMMDTIYALEKLSMDINALSDQSKIVSLNAFVEAFKAMDQGKTFAVVANELGSLSGNIKKMTGNVQKTLKSVDESLTENKNYCYDVAEFFANINEELKQFSKLMMRIEELSVSQSKSFQDFENKMLI